jgi:pyruvate carboxylase subunit B
MDCETGLDLQKLLDIGDFLESVLPKYAEHLATPRTAVIDARVLSHQIPGGMVSNLTSQLRQMESIDRLPEVLEEIARTRKELGYPPLVTPISQMVGTQSVSNVIAGRYRVVSEELKDYVMGLYGRTPAPIDQRTAELILKDRSGSRTHVTQRPADLLDPELQSAIEAVKDISSDMDDVLTYGLYPATGMKFLRIKHGLDPMPDEMKPRTLEEVAAEKARATQPKAPATPRSARTRAFNVHVGGEVYTVEVDPLDLPGGAAGTVVEPATRRPAPAPRASNETAIVAPMPGLISSYAVEVGQRVETGDTVVILESMKMENSLRSPTAGSVQALPFDAGATVNKDDVLAIIAP